MGCPFWRIVPANSFRFYRFLSRSGIFSGWYESTDFIEFEACCVGCSKWRLASGPVTERCGLSLAFADGSRTLRCDWRVRWDCIVENFHETYTEEYESIHLQQLAEPGQFLNKHASLHGGESLSADEASVAVALGADGVGWMELSADGDHRIIAIPDQEVTAVEALSDGRVVAGLSNGDVRLIDVLSGNTLQSIGTRDAEIADIVRLGDSRIAVESQAHVSSRGYRDWEILIVSLIDFSVSQRLSNGDSGDEVGHVYLLASNSDGRALVSMSETAVGDPRVQLWDTISGRVILDFLDSPYLTTRRLEFDIWNDLLLVDGDGVASLWNLREGSVARQFSHHKPFGTSAALVGDTVTYAPSSTLNGQSIEWWSSRLGFRDIVVPTDSYYPEVYVAGARIGIEGHDSLVLIS